MPIPLSPLWAGGERLEGILSESTAGGWETDSPLGCGASCPAVQSSFLAPAGVILTGVEKLIDWQSEHVISLKEAARLLPQRSGKPVHVSTLYRWVNPGLKGHVLETVQVGGTRCTSREALDRFFAALTADTQGRAAAPAPPLDRARRDALRRAEQILDSAGI